jgi:putative RNA 2'-phosphotransferase
MTSNKELVSISKFLSLVLRHKPQTIGLELDASGWASVDELLAKAAAARQTLSRALLEEVVLSSDKKRFALSDDGQKIRANQGHSIEVELGLQATQPPPVLYHGTASRFLPSILENGLDKRQRHHVHLTESIAIASAVGQRYGTLVMLKVDARRMAADGLLFFRSANDVWLTDSVPVTYLATSKDVP